MSFGPLARDLFAPFPGRTGRTLEICLVCMLVTVVSMTFEIPSPDVSVYVIFFAAKENSGLTIVTCLAFIIVVTVVVALLFVMTPLALNYATARVGIIGAVSFVAFFLTSTSKLAPVSGTIGLIAAYGLDLLQSSFLGEIATRGFFYAWLFVSVPMAVFAAYSLAFGRHPEVLLRDWLAARLVLVARGLRGEATRSELAEAVAGGNTALAGRLAMIKLFRRQPPDTLARLAALVPLTYALLLTSTTLRDEDGHASPDLPRRLDDLAGRVVRLPRIVEPTAGDRAPPAPVQTLDQQASALTTAMEAIVEGAPMPPQPPAPDKPKAGFFVPDAFSDPEHGRFALKGTLAVLVCYITFNLLDWSGIHTCLITCFIVALKTLGETFQKMILRIAGCLVGAALGLSALVFVLPHLTSITGLAILIGLVTFPAAWIAVGKPSVAYIGFQLGFAIYLCVLQGEAPKFDLTLARDRIIGILFGNLVIYLIFTRIYPTSILGSIREDLGRLVARCRAVLAAIPDHRPEPAAAKDIAEVQALLGSLMGKLPALGLEHRRSPNAPRYARSGQRGATALRDFVWDLGRLATYPAAPADDAAARDLTMRHADLAAALQRVAEPLAGANDPAKAKPKPEPVDHPDVEVASDPVARPSDPDRSGRMAALRSCHANVDRLGVALARYRRLLGEERPADA